MKIDFRQIILDHLSTLRNAQSGKISLFDLFIFYFLPLLLGGAAVWVALVPTKEFYNISITFFGIFIALLLNIQVAIFGIFQRNWDKPADARSAKLQEQKLAWKKLLLKEMNSSISYLILFSCIELFLFISLYICDATSKIWIFLIVASYAHFLLTLFMVVKRSHVLFQAEYE